MKNRQVRVHLGDVDAIKLGMSRFSLSDPYYLVLTISWPVFFVLTVSFYLSTNLFFALAYLVVPGCINGARPGVFLDHFFFSIETLATVGYGVMSPASIYGHVVASTEIIFGLMSMAVITGLVFTRFSRPRPRLLFSRVAVVAPYEERQALMLRVVNQRHGTVAEAAARLSLLRRTTTTQGRTLRRFIDLRLERASTPIISLSWTLIHVIDEQSPLWGMTAQDLEEAGGLLLASISGYEESISASVVARQAYPARKVLFGHEFVDVMDQLPSGEVVLDVARFHDTEPVATPPG
ncbi:MAG TPA: ion channel [Nevskia sp.]|nr:ion channel [Nevskia sp.]